MDGFSVYRKYGENNERSQKLLYELEEQSGFNAFFVVSYKELPLVCPLLSYLSTPQAAMLLGGRSNDSINTFLFKPIQRICKYPLLFRVSAYINEPCPSIGSGLIIWLYHTGAREVYT